MIHTEQTYYVILGIAPNTSNKEIKEAYRLLSFKYHPDRNAGSISTNEKMQVINEAYATLSNPAKRREYDISRGYGNIVPKFKTGSKVRISSHSSTPHKNHIGVVDKEPQKDSFRFWYDVKFESKNLVTVGRFAEEEIQEYSEQGFE